MDILVVIVFITDVLLFYMLSWIALGLIAFSSNLVRSMSNFSSIQIQYRINKCSPLLGAFPNKNITYR